MGGPGSATGEGMLPATGCRRLFKRSWLAIIRKGGCGGRTGFQARSGMTVLNGHFDGKQIVLDEPMPEAVPVNARVRVIVEEAGSAKPRSLREIAEMAVDAELPRDFSTQHAHYTKGFPRK